MQNHHVYPPFHVCDIMHDLLEGALQYEVKVMLLEMITVLLPDSPLATGVYGADLPLWMNTKFLTLNQSGTFELRHFLDMSLSRRGVTA